MALCLSTFACSSLGQGLGVFDQVLPSPRGLWPRSSFSLPKNAFPPTQKCFSPQITTWSTISLSFPFPPQEVSQKHPTKHSCAHTLDSILHLRVTPLYFLSSIHYDSGQVLNTCSFSVSPVEHLSHQTGVCFSHCYIPST